MEFPKGALSNIMEKDEELTDNMTAEEQQQLLRFEKPANK